MTKLMYQPTWESLDKRTLPDWFKNSSFGIIIHWGIYSVPAFCVYTEGAKIQNGSEWYLRRLKNPQYSTPSDKNKTTITFHNKNYPNKDYYDFIYDFTLSKWDPQIWAQLFKKAGAEYVIITAKHHDGFTLFPHNESKYKLKNKLLQWNSFDMGPKKDIIYELSKAIKKVGLHFGVYYSLMEWYPTSKNHIDKVHNQLKYLVNNYEPDILWFDGDWTKTPEEWKIKEFLCWLYNDSSVKNTIVVNDRLGKNTNGIHGDFYNFKDRFIPNNKIEHKWECIYSITPGWGHNIMHSPKDWKKFDELLDIYLKIKNYGGNLLLNIGPDKDGMIPKNEINILNQFGVYFEKKNEN